MISCDSQKARGIVYITLRVSLGVAHWTRIVVSAQDAVKSTDDGVILPVEKAKVKGTFKFDDKCGML